MNNPEFHQFNSIMFPVRVLHYIDLYSNNKQYCNQTNDRDVHTKRGNDNDDTIIVSGSFRNAVTIIARVDNDND